MIFVKFVMVTSLMRKLRWCISSEVVGGCAEMRKERLENLSLEARGGSERQR